MRLVLPLFFVLCAVIGSAHIAQGEVPSTDSPERRAVSIGHRGLRLFAEGEFAQARLAFEEADRLAHSPVFLLYQARSEKMLGNLLLARKLLQICAHETIEPSTPDAWRRAVADAVLELGEVSEAIPSLRFFVEGGAAYPVRVVAGSREFLLSEPESLAEVDPGVVKLVAIDALGNSFSTEVFLREGEHELPTALAFPTYRQNLTAPSADEGEEMRALQTAPQRPYRSGAHAAFFLGGSAFLFSVVATSLAVTKARAVKKNCVGSSCRPQDQQLAQSAVRWANLATAGVAVGATGLATGLGLLLVPGRNGAEISYRTRF